MPVYPGKNVFCVLGLCLLIIISIVFFLSLSFSGASILPKRMKHIASFPAAFFYWNLST